MTATATRPAKPLTKAQQKRLDKIEAAPYDPEVAEVPGECPACGSTARMVRKDTPATPNGDCTNGWHRRDSHPGPVPAEPDEAPSEPVEATETAEGTDTPPEPPAAVTRPVGTLAVRDGQNDWTPAQLAVLGTLIQQREKPPPAVLQMFLNNCQRTGLDPFARQIYLVGRPDNRTGETTWTTQTGIDGFRVVSQRSGEYAGMTPTQWCGPDGVWVDVWLPADPPAAARVGIYRRGFVEPLYAVATMKSYMPSGSGAFMWRKMPDVMLAKVAEALARRMAFPQDLSGLYTAEEMAQGENAAPALATITSEVVQPAPEPSADEAEVEKAMRHVMALAVLKDTTALSAYWRTLKAEAPAVHRAPVEFNGGEGTIANLIVWCGTNVDAAAEAASDWIDEHPLPDETTGETPMPGVVVEGVVAEDPPADAPTEGGEN